MSERLLGKVCVITGTGGSIGREAALIFAREGALVVGCGLQVDDAEATVEAVRAAGGTMVSLQPCDLTKRFCGHRDGRSRPEDVTLEQTLEAL